MKRLYVLAIALICITCMATSDLSARPMPFSSKFKVSNNSTATLPAFCIAVHSVGKMKLAVNNTGYFGDHSGYRRTPDCLTGEPIWTGCEYPKNSKIAMLYWGAIWLGGVVGKDTLVSTGVDGWSRAGRELAPDVAPFGDFVGRSIIDPESPLFEGAISEQDLLCVFTDTFLGNEDFEASIDYFRKGKHIPLNIEITQNSYAWSYGYAEDFVIFDLTLRNIGDKPVKSLYLGLYVDADVGDAQLPITSRLDDFSGFLHTASSLFGCGIEDTVNIAWTADNDGDPINGRWSDLLGSEEFKSVRHITGTRILQAPSESLDLSFNWWVGNLDPTYDFGPHRIESYRNFKTGGLGTPEGDVNKYHMLSNGEFDYDQVFTNQIPPWDTAWLKPDNKVAPIVSMGGDCRYLLSYGAFNLEPGATIPITFAYVAGENFHTDPDNINFLPDQPEIYYSNLDFSDLALNSMWADWVYDNPGVDTDSNGFAGDSRICVYDSLLVDGEWVATLADTQFYRGDGVPDWRAASPPPAPQFWLEPILNGVRVRFNGLYSETTKDIFSRLIDFEGYRIYMGRDDRESSLSLVASFDHENYDKYVYNPKRAPTPGYQLDDIPLTIEQIRCLYGLSFDPCDDSTFDPLSFTRARPYVHPYYPDSLFYFVKHDFNQYRPGIDSPIRKVYRNEPKPNFADSLLPEQLTEEGYPKYYEYEYIIDNLLPTVNYYFNVTAFDFGSPKSGLQALETSKMLNLTSAYPYGSQDQVDGTAERVYIYPNPYRADGDYRADGFEGRTEQHRIDGRVRRIHFENLPAKCWIRIYSIDGDLVRAMRHDYDLGDPNHTHDSWNLINRNIQIVVSGLYYWSVESDDGEVQIGKLVILL